MAADSLRELSLLATSGTFNQPVKLASNLNLASAFNRNNDPPYPPIIPKSSHDPLDGDGYEEGKEEGDQYTGTKKRNA